MDNNGDMLSVINYIKILFANLLKQAGTELCQAQSELIQIGRVVRKKIEVGKKVWLEKYFGSKNFMGLKTL